MSNTLNLKNALLTELKKIHNNVSYEDATSKTTFPYIVFELDNIDRNSWQMEVNIFNKSENVAELEALTDKIDEHFLRFIYRDEKQTFTTERNVRNNVKETDKSIKRRRLLFDLELYNEGMM